MDKKPNAIIGECKRSTLIRGSEIDGIEVHKGLVLHLINDECVHIDVMAIEKIRASVLASHLLQEEMDSVSGAVANSLGAIIMVGGDDKKKEGLN